MLVQCSFKARVKRHTFLFLFVLRDSSTQSREVWYDHAFIPAHKVLIRPYTLNIILQL